mmetsp:Transcript_4228/g.6189  ORF Transcript_4228/g.6189 Transcript_4228/m.6189 type:complete len:226 (+) Transcript_4228:119-796(+)
MSSWERSRYIPWSRIPDVTGTEYDSSKERVYRLLTKEANEEKARLENKQKGIEETTTVGGGSAAGGFVPPEMQVQSGSGAAGTIITKKKGLLQGVEYNTPDLMRSVAFGACIGSITGAVFGFMDGMRAVQESAILKNTSNMAKSKYLLEGTTRAGATFGVFFAGFHSLKYGIRVAADPGMWWEMAGAGAVGIGAMMSRPTTRASVPYAGMLIGMDAFSNYMKETQ